MASRTTATRTPRKAKGATKATNTLQIGPGLALDADYLAGRSLALLGKRGAGKTYTCRVLAEELVSAHVQTVIVDPMGVFWGCAPARTGNGRGCRSRCSEVSTGTPRWSPRQGRS